MNTLNDFISLGSLATIIGVLIKGYNFTQKQAREDESIKNRLANLELMKTELKEDLKDFKLKYDSENRLIFDKMDKNSEAINNKIDELKDLLFNLVKDK